PNNYYKLVIQISLSDFTNKPVPIFSALTTIDQYFITLKTLPFLPNRSCLKSIGHFDDNLIDNAITMSIGEIITIPTKLPRKSIIRLTIKFNSLILSPQPFTKFTNS